MKYKLKDLLRKLKAWKIALEVKFILWQVDRAIKKSQKKQKKLQNSKETA